MKSRRRGGGEEEQNHERQHPICWAAVGAWGCCVGVASDIRCARSQQSEVSRVGWQARRNMAWPLSVLGVLQHSHLQCF
jgi:hypothetical protein